MIDAEIGFTSDVIRNPKRFVGRTKLIRNCIHAINSKLGVIAIFGKRGVGKSSLLRQIQQMALGDYTLATNAGLSNEIPKRPRKYLTVYYSCDSMIKSGQELLNRICNDQDDEDGLLRLVPNDGKELIEFSRIEEKDIGSDLKVIKWGLKGIETSKYVKVVQNDVVQTFRNFINSVLTHQVKKRMKRDGLLILLDEFDVINNKKGIGSLIKSLSSNEIKFGVCGIGHDLSDLVEDHASVERLLEQGALHLQPMDHIESIEILNRAEILFKEKVRFNSDVKTQIAHVAQGYPYFVQLIGKSCVNILNQRNLKIVDMDALNSVMDSIKNGSAFPTLESAYQRAIGNSPERQLLLHILAEQPEDNTFFSEDIGRIYLKKVRKEAFDFDIQYVDQLVPRLLDLKFGPVLSRVPERQGIYEFINPVFKLYVQLRQF